MCQRSPRRRLMPTRSAGSMTPPGMWEMSGRARPLRESGQYDGFEPRRRLRGGVVERDERAGQDDDAGDLPGGEQSGANVEVLPRRARIERIRDDDAVRPDDRHRHPEPSLARDPLAQPQVRVQGDERDGETTDHDRTASDEAGRAAGGRRAGPRNVPAARAARGPARRKV